MVYQFQLSLQKRAALSFAIAFWEKKEVKAMMEEFFESRGFGKVRKPFRDWPELIKKVINLWDKNILPPKLAGEVIHILDALGKKIYCWYKFLYMADKLYPEFDNKVLDYMRPIYWTPYGTIDEVEIFKSSWLKNKSIKPPVLYNAACKFVLEEYIEALWKLVPIKIQRYYSMMSYVSEYSDQHLLVYWKYCRDGQLQDLDHYFTSALYKSVKNGETKSSPPFDPNHSVDENMIHASIYENNSVAMIYFWNKLSEEKKTENIVDFARNAVRYYVAYCEVKPFDAYKIEKYVEMCLFLVNQMTESQKKLFFNTPSVSSSSVYCAVPFARSGVKSAFLTMLALSWPWQEFFIPVLNDIQGYVELDSETVFEVLSSITWRMELRHTKGYAIQNSKYQCLLQTAWGIIPGSAKQKVEDTRLDAMLDNLLKMRDLDTIKMIFNDPDIAPVRIQYLECVKKIFEEWIMNGEYDFFDQFMQEILISDDEKKFIKASMDHIKLGNYFLGQGEYSLLVQFLNWKCKEIDEEEK